MTRDIPQACFSVLAGQVVTMQRLFLFLVLFPGLFLSLAGFAMAENPLVLDNRSGSSICSIRMSPAGENRWTGNLVGGLGECLYSGNSTTVPWNPAWSETAEWDVEISYGDRGTVVYEADLDLIPGMRVVADAADVFQAFPAAIDWDSLPRISNLEDAIRYIREVTEEDMPDHIPMYFVNGFFPKSEDLLTGSIITSWSHDELYRNGGTTRVVYSVRYYPGVRVAKAYLSDDLSDLTEEEIRLYKAALPVVREALAIPSELERELFIHDRVIATASYQKVEFDGKTFGQPELSAIGALLNGRANCQGYSDAFNMLGRMAGLKTGMWGGYFDGGAHSWNTVEIDGVNYFVDVTNDEVGAIFDNVNYYTYVYFNAPREIMAARHSWNRELEAGMKFRERIDSNYFYRTPEHFAGGRKYFGATYDSAAAGLDGVISGYQKAGRWTYWHVMVPYDDYFYNVNNSMKYFMKRFPEHRRISMNIRSHARWPYMFYLIVITPPE